MGHKHTHTYIPGVTVRYWMKRTNAWMLFDWLNKWLNEWMITASHTLGSVKFCNTHFHSFIHSFMHSFIDSLTHSPTYEFNFLKYFQAVCRTLKWCNVFFSNFWFQIAFVFGIRLKRLFLYKLADLIQHSLLIEGSVLAYYT